MTRAERPRGTCPVCGKDCAITDEGGARHHLTENPEYQSGPDSRKCLGVGQPPSGTRTEPGALRFLCRVPSGPEGCGHPVQLTANHRARTHLTPQGTPCAEGSSAPPIAVGPDGYRADTADWTDEDWDRALPDPHRHEADVAIAEAERLDREADADYEQALRDARPVQDLDPPHDRQSPATHDPVNPHTCQHDFGDHDVWDEQNGTEGQVSACLKCGLIEPALFDWRTPADLLAQMPEGIRRLAESNPGCWDCGHEVTPMADRFGPDGSVQRIVWVCSKRRGCKSRCGPTQCRPQHPTEDHLGNLVPGEHFRRHTAQRPLDRLVYQVQAVTEFCVQATVLNGAHAGRTGELTNLQEEITCTDQNGQRLARRDLRRDPGTSATSPGSFAPQPAPTPSSPAGHVRTPGRPSTPSRPAQPTPRPTAPAPGSTPATPATARPAAPPTTRATSSGPTATASGKPRTAAGTTDVAKDAFATAKQATAESDKYDRYGRYKLLHPKTGKPVAWTRATTYAKSISDTYNLSMWSQRMVLKGASLRPDIVASVATLEVKADRDRVNGLVEEAKKAAGDKVAANLGTAVHGFTEERDKALVGLPHKEPVIPEKLLPTVDAYEALLRDFGLEPVPGLIEFTTAVLQYEIAGTSDRCYRVTRDITFMLHGRTITLYAGEYVIGDVKSGADLSYGWLEICIQLAVYAQGLNTVGTWDWGTRVWGHPERDGVQIQVRTDVGLIPHLPVDRPEGAPLATLYAIDLDWGWATAVLCGQVRAARKEGNVATALTVADVDDPQDVNPDTDVPSAVHAQAVHTRPATLEEKARAVTTQTGASAVWKEAVAARTPKAEVDWLVLIMRAKLESHVEQGA